MTGIGGSAAIGSAGLLRLAALPVSAWLAGGSPGLFDRQRVLDERTGAYRARARDVAEEIGARLVPHAALDGADRARVLRVRRWLYNGSTTPAADAAHVTGLAELALPADRLAANLRDVVADAGALRSLRHEIGAAILIEEERLLAMPWRLLHESPAGRHAARSGDLAVYDDIARRVAAGEPWTSKRMRQRSDYLWRMITRGATRATPRGWLAHVALLPVVGAHGWTGPGALRVCDGAAIEVAENLDVRRAVHGTAETLLGDPSVEVALAPLARLEPDQLIVWALDGDSRTRLIETRLRRSPVLNAVITALADGPRRVDRLLDALTAQGLPGRPALTGLLAHLARQQALQVSVPPRRRLTTWRPVRAAAPAATDGAAADGAICGGGAGRAGGSSDDFVDVYRRAGTGIARAHARRFGSLALLALRVAALIHADSPGVARVPSNRLGAQPRRLLDIAADCLNATNAHPPGPQRLHEWPPVQRPESGYAGLVQALAKRMDGAVSVDLDDEDLDAFGAPRPDADWPLDCLLRPIRGATGELAVLDQIIPAGVYDARFASALTDLDGEPPQVRGYREFLARLGEAAAMRFVEILAPPLSTQAANAVRRPGYTELWTGDPDRSGYLRDGHARYLPLSQITLRTDAGHVVAEADGEAIWPILHTTRVAAPPWDTIVGLLLLASPQPSRARWRAPSHSLRAWPERDFVPRITVGGGLVLSPAQWRLDPSEFWRPGDHIADKMAALERLRRRHRLPRLVSVAVHVAGEPLAVDLSSLHGLRALERLVQRGASTLLMAELFAEPHRLAVHDEAAPDSGPSMAELLLRLPVDASPRALAHCFAQRAHLPHGHVAVSTTANPAEGRGYLTPA